MRKRAAPLRRPAPLCEEESEGWGGGGGGAHHGVDKLLLALAEDGDELGLLVVAVEHGRGEVDGVSVIVVVADVVVLPPAGVGATLRGCGGG